MEDLNLGEIVNKISRSKRIFICGNSGSGKTTLAQATGRAHQLPVTEIDVFRWEPGYKKRPGVEVERLILSELQKPGWVMEDSPVKFLSLISAKANLIIWLDPSTLGCLWRTVVRSFRRRKNVNYDVKGPEPLKEMLKHWFWVLEYPWRRRPKIMEILKNHPNVVRLKKWDKIKDLAMKI